MGDDEMRLMRLNLLRDLHFIDASKSEQSDIVRIQARIKLQNERLNELRFTPLATTVYLSHLPNPTPSHHLSCMRLPKCVRNEGCFIFLTRDWEKK